ncbi:response regulator transcription factor [Bifidobacterium sp. MA2]|uniref:Response regulator transcription factor n=1 Tax=Bifidobacterium santillanense TaxID=2809028 RepID=A0ABS5UM14_9BIFI|nr:response regulator transcription factor [Bifidobacterium santillanense]MBT1171945.1 response regulator transcription factor [Bifidobacterium santillanense]
MRSPNAIHTIRVMLVDNQPLILSGLTRIIDTQLDMTVIATATDGENAVRTARRIKPDVMLMDVRMPGLDGIQATRVIARDLPEMRIIGLTSYDTDAYAIGMFDAGASGFLLKNSSAEQLLDAIRAAATGNAVMDSSIMGRLNQRLVATDSARMSSSSASSADDSETSVRRDDGLPDFTNRERGILARIVQGDSNDQIAARLGISVSTVKTHIGNILRKTGQTNRVRLIVWAARHLQGM